MVKDRVDIQYFQKAENGIDLSKASRCRVDLKTFLERGCIVPVVSKTKGINPKPRRFASLLYFVIFSLYACLAALKGCVASFAGKEPPDGGTGLVIVTSSIVAGGQLGSP